jgi:hypothetical protein
VGPGSSENELLAIDHRNLHTGQEQSDVAMTWLVDESETMIQKRTGRDPVFYSVTGKLSSCRRINKSQAAIQHDGWQTKQTYRENSECTFSGAFV